MKKNITAIVISTLLLCSCTNNWNKEYAKKTCITGASLKAPDNPTSKAMIEKLCDCIGEKMVTKYKSEAEANKDLQGAEAMGIECMKESYAPPPSNTK